MEEEQDVAVRNLTFVEREVGHQCQERSSCRPSVPWSPCVGPSPSHSMMWTERRLLCVSLCRRVEGHDTSLLLTFEDLVAVKARLNEVAIGALLGEKMEQQVHVLL